MEKYLVAVTVFLAVVLVAIDDCGICATGAPEVMAFEPINVVWKTPQWSSS